MLRRYLQHVGYDVDFVQNVTDIDDRSINRAKETGEDWYEIVTGYYASFKRSMQRLGVRDPDSEPYATKYIPQILEMIGELVEKGYAYVSKDGVRSRLQIFALRTIGEPQHRRIGSRRVHRGR